MKKAYFLSALLLLSGCASPLPQDGENTEEPVMENHETITIDTQYGGFRLRFNIPENAARTVLRAVRPDGSEFKESTEVQVSYDSYDLFDLVAYTAANNDWYEDMKIRLRHLDQQDQIIEEEYSEAFHVTDCFCKEETRSVNGREPYVFSYSSEGHMYIPERSDEIDACTAVFRNESTEFSAVYYDARGGRKEIERSLNKAETETLLDLIQSGQLIRKDVRDPAFEILDGSTPASYHLTLKDSDRLEERWYEFEIEKSRSDELMAFLLSLCR